MRLTFPGPAVCSVQGREQVRIASANTSKPQGSAARHGNSKCVFIISANGFLNKDRDSVAAAPSTAAREGVERLSCTVVFGVDAGDRALEAATLFCTL